MVRKTKIGLLLGTRGLVMSAQREQRPTNPDVIFELAREADTAGLDSVWVGDSLVSKPRLEPLAVMSAIAAVTANVRIGTAVMLPAIRHPVPLAHSLATADILSHGRLIIGAGVGGGFTPDQVKDWTSAGVDPKTRAGRFTEMIQIMKRLWTEDHVSFDGKHFNIEDVTLYPRPIQSQGVPLLLATHYRTGSERQALRAARYGDGVIGISDYPDDFARMVTKVDEMATDDGRDLTNFEHVYYMTVHIGDDHRKAREEAEDFLISYYGVNHWGDRWGPWGTSDEIVAKMHEFVDAGADHLVVRFAGWDQLGQWERFQNEVLPKFGM